METSHQTTATETNYSSETRQTTTSSSGVVDMRYIKGYPVIIKALEVVFGLLAFLLVITSIDTCLLPGANGFFDFAMMFCVVTTVVLYFVLLFKLQQRLLRCNCIFWPQIELIYYIICLVILLIAVIILSAVACTNQLKAGVAFGWFALGVYIVDLVLAVRIFVKSRSSSHSWSHQETTTTTTTRY